MWRCQQHVAVTYSEEMGVWQMEGNGREEWERMGRTRWESSVSMFCLLLFCDSVFFLSAKNGACGDGEDQTAARRAFFLSMFF